MLHSTLIKKEKLMYESTLYEVVGTLERALFALYSGLERGKTEDKGTNKNTLEWS